VSRVSAKRKITSHNTAKIKESIEVVAKKARKDQSINDKEYGLKKSKEKYQKLSKQSHHALTYVLLSLKPFASTKHVYLSQRNLLLSSK
jgi:hypothetical protein